MAYEKVGATLPGVVASGDLTGSQFLFVKVDGEKTVGLAGAGEAVEGVLQNKPDTDHAATVWGCGTVSKVVAGAAVAAGAFVTPDAASKGVTAGTGDYIAGRCLTAAANPDELITVFITNPGRSA